MDKDETKIKNETKTTKEIDWDEVDKEYEKWLENISNFKIDDDWIVEVAEFAVDCFC